jgi:hypothetical protein
MAAEVKAKLSGLGKQVFSGLKGEQLISFLGADVVREVLSHSISAVRASKSQPAPAPQPSNVQVDEEGKQVRARTPYTNVRKFFRG